MVIPATVRTRTSREGYLGCSFRARADSTGFRLDFLSSICATGSPYDAGAPNTEKKYYILLAYVMQRMKNDYVIIAKR